jgi:hypothetical protein
MGKLTRTQKIIARNKAVRDIARLQREGKEVPLELLSKVKWDRKISRNAI